jgi:hypothetical protein
MRGGVTDHSSQIKTAYARQTQRGMGSQKLLSLSMSMPKVKVINFFFDFSTTNQQYFSPTTNQDQPPDKCQPTFFFSNRKSAIFTNQRLHNTK